MAKATVIAAAIIALGIVGHGFLESGRFTLTRVSDGIAFRLDRWTGSVQVCGYWSDAPFSCFENDPGDVWVPVDEPSSVPTSKNSN